jgi:hypothetical protein
MLPKDLPSHDPYPASNGGNGSKSWEPPGSSPC